MVTTPDTLDGSPTLLHAFLRHVEHSPHRVALVDGRRRIRYRDLARAAEAVRGDLIAAGVQPGEHVGISMGRSWRVVAAILGTLAAGARYVPLDPSYPPARLDVMVDDSALRVVCVDTPGRTGRLGELTQIPVSGELAETEPPADAAPSGGYVIYTSGSTGRPKGVVIPQGHVRELFLGATASHFSFSSEDVWTLYHSYSFDFSVWEMWGALLFGGSLVVVDEAARRDPDRLLGLMQEHRVTVLSQVPSPFKYLTLAYQRHPRPLRSLRYVVFGGEALDPPSVRRWLSLRTGPEQLVNMYGITETTVHVTAAVISPSHVADDSVPAPIGAPLPHLEVAVVRPDGTVAPPGQPGEIWVCGSTLSPGYLGHPDLTAQRFVTRDLGTGVRRWYRSGDVATRDPAGDLVYRGRTDAQVNLRGFRIELGEVESALRGTAAVLDAAATVTDLPGDEHTLVALVVLADRAAAATGHQLRELCRRRLPAHMVPDRVVRVKAIPTTPGGGKVDRTAVAALARQ